MAHSFVHLRDRQCMFKDADLRACIGVMLEELAEHPSDAYQDVASVVEQWSAHCRDAGPGLILLDLAPVLSSPRRLTEFHELLAAVERRIDSRYGSHVPAAILQEQVGAPHLEWPDYPTKFIRAVVHEMQRMTP